MWLTLWTRARLIDDFILVIVAPVGVQAGAIAAARAGGSNLPIQVVRPVQNALAHLAEGRGVEVAEVFQRDLKGAALVAGVVEELAGFFIEAPVLGHSSEAGVELVLGDLGGHPGRS